MAYKRISKAIQRFKENYLHEVETIDTIYWKDVYIIIGYFLMMGLMFMFVIYLWEIMLWLIERS